MQEKYFAKRPNSAPKVQPTTIVGMKIPPGNAAPNDTTIKRKNETEINAKLRAENACGCSVIHATCEGQQTEIVTHRDRHKYPTGSAALRFTACGKL
jgi:hypothetical protein